MIATPNFWDDAKKSATVVHERNQLKQKLDRVSSLKKKIEDNVQLLDTLKEQLDLEIQDLLTSEMQEIEEELSDLELLLLLNGEFDSNGALLEIHPGAGGTEACDWANMLYRMYLRWCEQHHYQVEVLEEQPGEEAGMKSVTLMVKGEYAYGYLKCEKGVHRLVRISPFDSGARRHTSFASVDVTPLFDHQAIELDIKDSDLKIDVYRSSGAGGQHVNTTDSAVRITHLPTKIVVTCQNERSQIQNKEQALKMLKNKLKLLEIERKNNELKEIKGEQKNIEFGSQIRSYVMHPYSMVKDHRTSYETSDVSKVLDGDINEFIESKLKEDKNEKKE